MSTWQKTFGLILVVYLIFGYQGRARASERFELKDGTVIVGDIVDVSEDTFTIKTRFGKVSIRREHLRPKKEGGVQLIEEEEISKVSGPEKESILQRFREEKLWMKANKGPDVDLKWEDTSSKIESCKILLRDFKVVKGKNEKEIGEVGLLQLTGDIDGARWLKEKKDSLFLWKMLGMGMCIGGGVMEVLSLSAPYQYRMARISMGPIVSGVGAIIWWWNTSQESYYCLGGAEAIRLIIKFNKELGEKMGVSTDYIAEVPLFRF